MHKQVFFGKEARSLEIDSVPCFNAQDTLTMQI